MIFTACGGEDPAMTTAIRLSLALAALLPGVVLGNGGGYTRGGLHRAGDIVVFEPQEVEKIRILDEKLDVALGPQEAAVEIRYLMRNETDGKVKVRFGFPVEETSDDYSMMGGPEQKTDKLKYCKDYVISAGGKEIAAKWQLEKNPEGDKRFKGIVGWLVSEVTFTAKEEKPVSIRFKSSYPLVSWTVSEDGSDSAGIFNYRLSTAACWAGTIGSGRITLRPAGIPAGDLKVLKPVNRFKKEGDNWVWNFENLEPAMADDLEIEARPEENSYGRAADGSFDGKGRATFIERAGKWGIRHRNYNVKASSTLEPTPELIGKRNYDASLVKQGSGQVGAWSEGAKGPGTGEWLELTPEVPKPLTEINLMPGYTMSRELFEANARPKKVLVELNGEHRFHADIPDAPEWARIPVNGYTKPVKTIRLTFEEVYKGARYEDLCVSGVSLEVKLDKKPKISPSR